LAVVVIFAYVHVFISNDPFETNKIFKVIVYEMYCAF